MLDIVSIGDTTVDVFLAVDDATVLCDIDTDACTISMNYADKIPVSSAKEILAVGNAANNAVGSHRLGLKTALYTHLGNDISGIKMRETLIEQGVSDKYIVMDEDRGSNYSTVLNYKAERTILVYHEPRDYDLPDIQDSKWIYLTSVAAGHEKLHEQVYKRIAEDGVKLGFNPGSHQLNAGLEKLKDLIEVSEVFIVNKEEAWKLFGKEDDIKTLLAKIKDHGPTYVIVTDGPGGSYGFDGEQYLHLGTLDSEVIERTGAGDAYSTGLITALIEGKKLDEAMMWGNLNSTNVLKYIGAQEGLLTIDQMRMQFEEHNDFRPQNI
jgi:sugar/nucleoside kinase (ribokinase family)